MILFLLPIRIEIQMRILAHLTFPGLLFLTALLLGLSCKRDKGSRSEDQLFTLMPESYTGAGFVNHLDYDEQLKKKFNIYTYRNFYNGGGVALGDVNNDGLMDIFLSSNMGPNVLYLNKGDFKFEDISERAGISGKGEWSTGSSLADVNGDGWCDIYVCNSGNVEGDERLNELYINNGDLTFTESAADYGIDDHGYSTHGPSSIMIATATWISIYLITHSKPSEALISLQTSAW